jgi:hypothetical protein
MPNLWNPDFGEWDGDLRVEKTVEIDHNGAANARDGWVVRCHDCDESGPGQHDGDPLAAHQNLLCTLLIALRVAKIFYRGDLYAPLLRFDQFVADCLDGPGNPEDNGRPTSQYCHEYVPEDGLLLHWWETWRTWELKNGNYELCDIP